MTTKFILRVVEGRLPAREFAFEPPRLCRLGRSSDCDLRFPNEDGFLNVSRHHCLLDVEVSGVWVRDLGSRNGTYLNDLKIGQRDRDWSVSVLGPPELDTYELCDGDTLRVGNIVFRVEFVKGPAVEAPAGVAGWPGERAESHTDARGLCGTGSVCGPNFI
jgi:serine/threonine-protein kinase